MPTNPVNPAFPTDFGRDVHCLLGLPFDAVTTRSVAEHIRTCAEVRQPCFLSTPNLNFAVMASNDAAFRGSVLRSNLVTADGMPLVWVARLLGVPLPERVSGSNVFEALRRSRGRTLRVFFFGGTSESGSAANAALRAEGGGATGVGAIAPGFGSVEEMSDQTTLDAINASRADFVLVALGARKGQAWIEANRSRLSAPVISYFGAVINFTAGHTRRSPNVLQSLGLEWLWRIAHEPALWRRYAGDGVAFLKMLATRVVPLAIDHWWRTLRIKSATTGRVDSRTDDLRHMLCLSGFFVDHQLQPVREAFATAVATGGPIDVDLAQTTAVSPALVGLLLLLSGHQSKVEQPLRLLAVSSSLARRLRWHGAGYLLE